MKRNLYNLSLYTSALCNLKCKYCYVDKNIYLNEMEKKIKKYCRLDYYIDFLEKLSPYFNYDGFYSVSMWGSEPTIGLKDFLPVVQGLIDKFPSIQKTMFSSNFCHPNFLENFTYFYSNLKKDKLKVYTQASIDGPEYINDKNRGTGVTQKIVSNFKEIIDIASGMQNDRFFSFNLKSTLTIDEVRYILENNLLESHFDFFAENFAKYNQIKDNIRVMMPVTTLVVPGEYTQDDGFVFAEFCKKGYKLAKSGRYKYPYGDRLIPFKEVFEGRCKNTNFKSYQDGYGYCGLGSSDIGLLPEYQISLCHREFSTMIENYRIAQSNFKDNYVDNRIYSSSIRNSPTLFDISVAEKQFEVFKKYQNSTSTALNVSTANLIRCLARLGQIDKRYDSEEMSLFGAKLLRLSFGICAKDVIDLTGTCCTTYASAARLMLNGADKIMTKDTEYEF